MEREREREKNSAITNRIEQREWTGEVEGIMEGCRFKEIGVRLLSGMLGLAGLQHELRS